MLHVVRIRVKKTLALACGEILLSQCRLQPSHLCIIPAHSHEGFSQVALSCTSVLSLLNRSTILHSVRSIWNIVFGTIMIFLQLEWKKMIASNGFLSHCSCAASSLFFFVGTNAMRTDEKTNEGEVIFSLFAGFSCIFVGVVELLLASSVGPDDDVTLDRAGSGGRSQTEPTLTVNLTPNRYRLGIGTHVQRPFAPFSSELSSRTSHPALILTCRLVCTRSLRALGPGCRCSGLGRHQMQVPSPGECGVELWQQQQRSQRQSVLQ